MMTVLFRICVVAACFSLTCGSISLYAQRRTKVPSTSTRSNQKRKPSVTDKEESKSSSQALAMYADAASYQNNGAFELAIEEWSKFLKTFPDDPKIVDARYNLGVCQLQEKQFLPAIENLEAVITSGDEFNRMEDAYLNLGWAQYSLGLQDKREYFQQASRTFATLLEKYPKTEHVDQTLFFIGESLYLLGSKKKAAEFYRRLCEGNKGSTLRSDGLYAWGVTYEELRDYEKASEIYDTFLREFPEHELVTEIRMRKAETLLQRGQDVKAEEIFAQVAALKEFDAADHAAFRHAVSVAGQKRFEEAADLYLKLSQNFPKSNYANDAHIAAARALVRAAKTNAAAEIYAQIIESKGPHAPEAAHWQNRVYLRHGDPERALALAQDSLEMAADSPYLVNLKIDQADALYELKNRMPECLELFIAIAEDHHDHPLAAQSLYNAAYVALQLNRSDEGLRLCKTFVERYVQHLLVADVTNIEAECYLQRKEYDKAEAIHRRMIKTNDGQPSSIPWVIRLASVKHIRGDNEGAIDVLQPEMESIKSPPQRAEALHIVGVSQFNLRNYEQSEQALAESYKTSIQWRQADETLLYLSRTQRRQKNMGRAIEIARRVFEEFPESTVLDQVQFRLAEYHYVAGQYDQSITLYRELLHKWPKSSLLPYAVFGKGWAEIRAENHAEAIGSFSALIEGFANHRLAKQAYQARATCYQQTGEFAKGLADIATYLKANGSLPNRLDAYYVRGLCLAGLEKHQESVAVFEAILEHANAYASIDKVRYELAWAYRQLKQNEDAIAQFATLATSHPDSPLAAEASYHVGEAKYDESQYAEALKWYAKSQQNEVGQDLAAKALYKTAWSQYQLGNYGQALAAFSREAAVENESVLGRESRFMVAECLFKMEEYDKALAAYEKSQELAPENEDMRVLTLLHGAQAIAQSEQWQKSLQWLAKIQEDYPSTGYIAQVVFERGWALHNLGEVQSALAAFSQAAEKSRGEVGARSRFMMGEIRFSQKAHDAAIREFQRVMYGYGGEKASSLVKRWQAKAGLEAGQCAGVLASRANGQRRAKFVRDAQQFFRFVVTKHPDSDEALAAKQQLAQLRR